MYDLTKLKKKSEPVESYLLSSNKKTPSFAKRFAEYKLDSDVTEELKNHIDSIVIIAFSAEWCPDCRNNIPVLGLARAT
jgi:thiol:disulfide interchange protein